MNRITWVILLLVCLGHKALAGECTADNCGVCKEIELESDNTMVRCTRCSFLFLSEKNLRMPVLDARPENTIGKNLCSSKLVYMIVILILVLFAICVVIILCFLYGRKNKHESRVIHPEKNEGEELASRVVENGAGQRSKQESTRQVIDLNDISPQSPDFDNHIQPQNQMNGYKPGTNDGVQAQYGLYQYNTHYPEAIDPPLNKNESSERAVFSNDDSRTQFTYKDHLQRQVYGSANDQGDEPPVYSLNQRPEDYSMY